MEEGELGNYVAAVIWGAASAAIGRRILKRRGLLDANPPAAEQPAAPAQNLQYIATEQAATERWYTCPLCGQLVPEGKACDCQAVQRAAPPSETEAAAAPAAGAAQPDLQPAVPAAKPAKQKPRRITVFLAVLCILLAVNSAFLFCRVYFLYQENETMSADYATLEDQVSSLNQMVTSLKATNTTLEKQNDNLQYSSAEDTATLNFFESKIGFIVDGSSYYHTYDCSVFQNADEFWAHNIEYCQYLGYSAHSACWG